MTTAIVTASEMTQLCDLWITGRALPRPLRRRMVAIGMLGQMPDGTYGFTAAGTEHMLKHAPRSSWPKTGSWADKNPIERQREIYSGRRSMLLAAASMAIGVGR